MVLGLEVGMPKTLLEGDAMTRPIILAILFLLAACGGSGGGGKGTSVVGDKDKQEQR